MTEAGSRCRRVQNLLSDHSTMPSNEIQHMQPEMSESEICSKQLMTSQSIYLHFVTSILPFRRLPCYAESTQTDAEGVHSTYIHTLELHCPLQLQRRSSHRFLLHLKCLSHPTRLLGLSSNMGRIERRTSDGEVEGYRRRDQGSQLSN